MTYFTQLLSQRALPLRFPRQHTEDVQRHVRTHQTAPSAERAPFRRQIDFWAFSVATAVALELTPLGGPSSKWGERFIDTRSVEMSDELCNLLAIVAFNHLSDDGIDDPAQIIEVGNCLAAAGCSVVLDSLSTPDLRLTPLDKALTFAASTLASAADSS